MPSQSYPRKQALTLLRYRAMADRFDELYKQQRLRYDDCMTQIAREYFVEPSSVLRAINTAPSVAEANEIRGFLYPEG